MIYFLVKRHNKVRPNKLCTKNRILDTPCKRENMLADDEVITDSPSALAWSLKEPIQGINTRPAPIAQANMANKIQRMALNKSTLLATK